jgi:hypothetical protein
MAIAACVMDIFKKGYDEGFKKGKANGLVG